MKALKSLIAAAAVSLGALAPMTSNASLIMTIDDLSTAGVDVTIVDNGANDASALANYIQYGLSAGTWTLSATSGFGNGMSDIFGIDLLSFSASSSAGGTLRISLTQTDLNFGGVPGPQTITSLIGGTTQGSITYSAYADDSNTAFGQGALLFSGASGTGAFSDSLATTTSLTDPFSLTLVVDINHSGKKSTSFDFASQIPEPGSLALLSVALLGAGAATRRRKS